MKRIEICNSTQQIKIIEDLSYEIWNEYYKDILKKEQIDYMLEKFQSAASLKEQIFEKGYRYYILFDDENPIGYCGMYPNRDKRRLNLSKLYIKSEYRNKGLGQFLLDEVITFAKELDLDNIVLSVNKENKDAIEFYKKKGFVLSGQQYLDIGSNFYMDDYFYKLYI